MVVALLNALLAGTPPLLYVVVMFLANIVVGWVALELARSYSRKERERAEGPKKVVEVGHS
jgi:threonine/homoserine/homoserine lactone efflux protein